MEKIWLKKSYPPNVPHEIEPNKYTSLADMFAHNTNKFADKTAFINMGSKLSYDELWEKSNAFAAYLQQELGFKKGDTFAIMIPNTLQYPIALFGALIAGLVVVNVNPLYTARELKHQIKDAECKGILIVENFAHTLSEIIDDVPVKHVILTALGDCLGMIKGSLVNVVVKHVKKLVPPFNLPDAMSFNEVINAGNDLVLTPVEIDREDLAFLQYTGGTTGPSKGAMLSHRNMLANLEQAKAAISPTMNEGEELVVTALPLYHIFALTANCFTFVALGGANLLISNPRDMKAFVKELAKYPFTAITGVNTLFNGLIHNSAFKQLNFSALKLSIGGGMAVQRAVAERWFKITNNTLLEGYGLTECAPIVSLCPYDQKEYNGTIGLPVPSTDIKIVKEDGELAQIGESGEMHVKGPQVMQGYFNAPEETATVISGDWFATGDIAIMDRTGYFSIVDRKKDMILVSGFNVFPNEVEDVIMMHGGILEVAAVGVPNEVSGEVVKVFVVLKDKNINQQDLIVYCRKNLTSYKVPKLVEFRDELPKTNVGKVLRRELR